MLLLDACTLKLPGGNASPPDGSIAVGYRHTMAITNSGIVVTDGFHPPCIYPTNCGRFQFTMNFTGGTFGLGDARVYFDAGSGRFFGTSVVGQPLLEFVGILISQPDSTDWGLPYPSAYTTAEVPSPGGFGDQPKLGVGDSAVLVAANAAGAQAMMYCDKGSLITGIANCVQIADDHPNYSPWMPAHTWNGTGDVYAVRFDATGCNMIVGHGFGPWNAPTWQTKRYPLANCIGRANATQPNGAAVQYGLYQPDDFYYDREHDTFYEVVTDACHGTPCVRLLNFSGGWANLAMHQLCTFDDSANGNGTFDASVAVDAIGNPLGIMLTSGPNLPLSDDAFGFSILNPSCQLRALFDGLASVPGALPRFGDFSMCARDPTGNFIWCEGQIADIQNGAVIETGLMSQVCTNPATSAYGGYCQ